MDNYWATRYSIWILITVLLILGSGCTWMSPSVPRGYGWQLSSAGDSNTVVMIPTIHDGNKLTKTLPRWVERSLDRAGIVAVEIDPWAMNFEERVKNCALRESLLAQQIIQPDAARRLVAFADARGVIRHGDWTRLTLAQAGEVVSALSMGAAGLSVESGIDTTAMSRVSRSNQRVVELENLCEVVRTLRGNAIQTHLALNEVISDLENGLYSEYMKAAIAAWIEGDQNRLTSTLLNLRAKSPQFNTAFAKTVEARNEEIAKSIMALKQERTNVVVLVGAAHFVGEKSVEFYLRRYGATLSPINPSDS